MFYLYICNFTSTYVCSTYTYVEVKLVQKVGDIHKFYEIELENKKFSEKFRDF